MLWRRAKTYITSPIGRALRDELNSTQALVDGFDFSALQATHACIIGAGGIGAPIATALVRKGIGKLSIVDDDVVELKNCTRQPFGKADIGKFKAHRLARNLAADGLFPTELKAYPFRFQELLDRGHHVGDADILICGVDNNPTRRAVCEHAITHAKHVIHAAVSRTGNEAYVMVQVPRQACWACALPHYVNLDSYPCGLPGIIDVLFVTAGHVVYVIDTIIGARVREWNFKEIFLHGALPDRARVVDRRSDCLICGDRS